MLEENRSNDFAHLPQRISSSLILSVFQILTQRETIDAYHPRVVVGGGSGVAYSHR